MNPRPPIACTLAPAELPQRAAEMESLARDALVSVERGVRDVTLRFRPGPETLRRVEAVVAAESRCCAFLHFELEAETHGTALTIATPEGGEQILRELAERFASARTC